MVADTDRDKWAVFRIVDFYRRQPTDYADYFAAAWRYQHRAAIGSKGASLADIAHGLNVSPKYLATVWSTLTEREEQIGPVAKLQTMFRALPTPERGMSNEVREGCVAMRDYVVRIRESIVPEVKNLKVNGMNGIANGVG